MNIHLKILPFIILLTGSCSHYITRESGLSSLCILRSVTKTTPDSASLLQGQVCDRETGDPLIGANIVIRGTHYGGATDAFGNYTIRNIPPGNYIIQASYVAYHSGLSDSLNIHENEAIVLYFRLSQAAVNVTY
jgi:hypothetical protein